MSAKFYGWYLGVCIFIGWLAAISLAYHFRKHLYVAAFVFAFIMKLSTMLMLIGQLFLKKEK